MVVYVIVISIFPVVVIERPSYHVVIIKVLIIVVNQIIAPVVCECDWHTVTRGIVHGGVGGILAKDPEPPNVSVGVVLLVASPSLAVVYQVVVFGAIVNHIPVVVPIPTVLVLTRSVLAVNMNV